MKVVEYSVQGDSFLAGQPRTWTSKEVANAFSSEIDMAPDGKRFVAVISMEAAEQRPSTHVTFLFNFYDQLRQRVPVRP